MSSLIRSVEGADLDAVAALHAEAFAASPHGHHGEAALVRALHEEGDVLASLGCWRNGALVGHVLFTRMTVDAEGQVLSAAALAPVAVDAAHRRQGIAARLIEAGHDALRLQGVGLVFVLGDPHFYGRFGYDPACAAPFESPFAGPHFMACRLDRGLHRPQRGRATHAPAFSRLA